MAQIDQLDLCRMHGDDIKKLTEEIETLTQRQTEVRTTLYGVEGHPNGLVGDIKDIRKTQTKILRHIYIAVGAISAIVWIIDLIKR